MKWKDIKLVALQRMFAITGDEIVQDSTTMPYIKSMPGAANEALQILSTSGKLLVRSVEITQDGLETGAKMYDFNTLVPDFFTLKPDGVFKKNNKGYGKSYNYCMEGNSILVLNGEDAGSWRIYYNAYPKMLSKDTPDEYELPLDPEVAVLVPLYMASQLYKDDDIAQSVQFRNEFELGRELLIQNARNQMPTTGFDSFVNISGWTR